MAGKKNNGNVGDSRPKNKTESNLLKSLKDGVDDLKDKTKGLSKASKNDIEDLSKLATEKIDSVASKLDSMSGGLSNSIDKLSNNIVGISDIISSAFKRTRNDLGDIDKEAQVTYERNKKRTEELNKATTKRAKQRIEKKYTDSYSKEEYLKSQREEVAKRILEARQNGGKESKEDRNSYIKLSNDIKDLQEKEMSASVGVVETVANKAVDILKNVVKDVLTYFADNLAKGLTESVNFNLQNYTELAGRTGYGKETLTALESLISAYKESGYGNAVNISDELKPMYLELAKQGLQGDNLRNTAITNTIDKKIMPWLETTSDYWITLSDNLSSQTMSIIKGQQLALNQTEAGNRLLQTGVVSQLTQQMTPLLQSIKDDVFSQAHAEEIYQLAQGFVEGGYSPEQAKQMASAYLNMQMNPYQAITSGDVSQTLMALSYARGDNALQTFKQLGDIAGRGVSNNMIASSAYANTFMASFDIPKTSEGLRMFADTASNLDTNLKSVTTDFEDLYGKTQSSVNDYVSASQELINAMNNFVAGVGDKISGSALAPVASSTVSGLVAGIPTAISGILSAKSIGKIVKKAVGAGGAEAGVNSALGGATKFASHIGKLFGVQKGAGLLVNAKNVLGSTAGKALGGIGSAVSIGIDAFGGYKRNKSSGLKGGQLAGATIGDALTGNTDKITFGNTVSQIAKYAGLGTVIGGPLGTAIGAFGGLLMGTAGVAIKNKIKESKGMTESQLSAQNSVKQISESASSNADIQSLVKIIYSIDTKLDNLKSISDDVSALNKKILINKSENTKMQMVDPYKTFASSDAVQTQDILNELKTFENNIGSSIDLSFVKTGFETTNTILSTISSDLVSDKLKVSVLNDFQQNTKDKESIASSLSSVTVIADTLTNINETLTSGKVKVVAVSNYSDTLFTDFNNRNNKVSKNESTTESKIESIDNDNYRAELLNRITSVGTEIVNAINNTDKPQGVKEINKPFVFSPSIENMGYLKSNTGLVNG